MLRVIVADDHAVVRHGVDKLLTKAMNVSEVAEAGTADELVELVRKGRWDLLVLDITMPGRSGLEVLGEILAYQPDLPVLVMSMHPEDQLAVRVLQAGAKGYLTKGSAPEELVTAVQRILSGGRYVSDSLAEILLRGRLTNSAGEAHEALSNREFEVMRLLASGHTVSEAAGMLSLSVKTVSTYRARVLQKLGMRTNAELTHYSIKHGLVE